MDGYLILLVLVAAYFAVVLAGLKRKAWKRLDISFYGPMLIWRTLRGQRAIARLARLRAPWRLISGLCVAVAFIAMAALTVFIVWVTVFAPFDEPRIVLTVLIEDIEGVQAAALPAAKEILNWYFSENKG